MMYADDTVICCENREQVKEAEVKVDEFNYLGSTIQSSIVDERGEEAGVERVEMSVRGDLRQKDSKKGRFARW